MGFGEEDGGITLGFCIGGHVRGYLCQQHTCRRKKVCGGISRLE